jgi:cytidine deaminase
MKIMKTTISPSTIKSLIEIAHLAKENAYAPYSRFRVGAALQTDDGAIFAGCNVENSSYSLTICAERTALFKAVCQAHKKFRAIAIVSDDRNFLPPCGACRQVLSEFAPDLTLILTTVRGNVRVTTLGKLFPMPADLKRLGKRTKT